jgi:Mn2+/Fe2+ NRAMP family transporter
LTLVLVGGFRLFERLMSVCIGVMFAAVLVTALMARPDWAAVGTGLIRPSIPEGGLPWVLGILGGVGGTVTLLSYGYWIREQGREGAAGVRACRLDLGLGYIMTALFGVAMVMIGSRVNIEGGGAKVAPVLADQLGQIMGPAGRWVFLIGFWGAVFSSLLGVWQSVPYMFADFLHVRRGRGDENRRAVDFTKTSAYRAYLVALAIVPLPVLWISVTRAQLMYAVLGSLFMPLLALTLLIMNNRTDWVGKRYRSGWLTNAILVITLAFFAYVGYTGAAEKIRQLLGA